MQWLNCVLNRPHYRIQRNGLGECFVSYKMNFFSERQYLYKQRSYGHDSYFTCSRKEFRVRYSNSVKLTRVEADIALEEARRLVASSLKYICDQAARKQLRTIYKEP